MGDAFCIHMYMYILIYARMYIFPYVRMSIHCHNADAMGDCSMCVCVCVFLYLCINV